jgi:abequosyltransferase
MKLLSLCIPTYNRAKFLEESLQAIIRSIPAEFEDKIEIVVSNNASIDDTEVLLGRFQEQYANLDWVIVQQKPNIGPSNVTKVIEYASGEFIWIIADDDIVTPTSIPLILQKIQEFDKAGSFLINYAGFEKSQSEATIGNLFPIQKNTYLTVDEIFTKIDTQHITFLSLLIFRKKILDESNFLPYLETQITQSFIFLECMCKLPTVAIGDILLSVRAGNSGSYNFFKVFITNYSLFLNYLKPRIDKHIFEKFKSRYIYRFLCKYIFLFKMQKNMGDFKINYKEFIERTIDAFGINSQSIIPIFLALIPKFIFSIFISPIYLFLRNRDRKLRNE